MVGICRLRDSGTGGYPVRAGLGFMARLPTTEARTDLIPIKYGTRVPRCHYPGWDGRLHHHLDQACSRIKPHIALRLNVGCLNKFGQRDLDLTFRDTIQYIHQNDPLKDGGRLELNLMAPKGKTPVTMSSITSDYGKTTRMVRSLINCTLSRTDSCGHCVAKSTMTSLPVAGFEANVS